MRIYKHGQVMGKTEKGELQISHIELKVAMRDYDNSNLVEFLRKKGFKCAGYILMVNSDQESYKP